MGRCILAIPKPKIYSLKPHACKVYCSMPVCFLHFWFNRNLLYQKKIYTVFVDKGHRYNWHLPSLLTGAYRETQKGGGEIEAGGEYLRKINSFCRILNKLSQKGGGRKPSPPPPVHLYLLTSIYLSITLDSPDIDITADWLGWFVLILFGWFISLK